MGIIVMTRKYIVCIFWYYWNDNWHRTLAFTVLLLLHGTGRRNETYRSILLNETTWARSPRIFFPNGSGTPIPVSKLVKDLGVQADNVFSSSAQFTEAENKAKRLIFMIRHSFQTLLKSAFLPLYGSLVRPHLEYGMPGCSTIPVADINHWERIQR